MGRSCMFALSLFLAFLIPMVQAGDDGDWRNRKLDPKLWSDGPELEGSPMDEPQSGDPVIIINVSYVPGHGQSRVEGTIIIELFEEWAPITVSNMVKHVENDLYDGIFFHRVIDDFVTQGGDPFCYTIGLYPGTSPGCGNGGTGDTIPLETHPNLSHVDGAIGMARGTDVDSADCQWYIAETEAHNLDPENRDDGGYATFGVVRDGMSHVRQIALTPTSDDPTGLAIIQNPLSSAGRPFYEVKILDISMLGVIGTFDIIDSPNQSASTVEIVTDIMSYFMFELVLVICAIIAVLINKLFRNVNKFSSDGENQHFYNLQVDADSQVMDAVLFDD